MIGLALTLIGGAVASSGPTLGFAGGAFLYGAEENLGSTWTLVPRLGYRVVAPLALELDVGWMQGVTDQGRWYQSWTPRLGARLDFTPARRLRPFLVAGGGAIYKDISRPDDVEAEQANGQGLGNYVNPDLDALLNIGPGLELGLVGGLALRTDLRYALNIGGEPHGETPDRFSDLEWTLGVSWAPGQGALEEEAVAEEAPAEAPPVEEPAAEAPPAALVEPEDALVWAPHPICRWVPGAELEALRAEVGEDFPLRVTAPGHLPSLVEGDGDVSLQAAPPQGALVIVASAGDALTAGGASIPVGGDGLAVLNAPEGPIEIVIEGAGRRASYDLAVGSGYGIWLRAPPVEPRRVLFPVGGAALSAAEAEALAPLADHPGGYAYTVVGSFSPEGALEANLARARQRAEAVRDALIAAGLPPERALAAEPAEPEPGLTPAQQRSVQIRPTPAEGATP